MAEAKGRRVTIEGVNRIRKVLADGTVRYFYYCWRGRGAPQFWQCDGRPVDKPSRAFVEAYQSAMKERTQVKDDFDGIAARYLESPGYKALAEKTRSDYRKLIDGARARFRNAPLEVIADPRFRAEIIRYRDTMADRPRTADLAVLGAHLVLEHGRNLGLLGANPAAGIPSLYSRPDDKRPWTAEELVRFEAAAEPQVRDAFNLIRYLALRRKDAIAVTWSADKGTHIAWETSKGKRHKREAVIPILPEARAFLDDLKRRNAVKLSDMATRRARKGKAVPLAKPVMLVTQDGTPWGDEGSITRAFRQTWLDVLAPDRQEGDELPETPTPHRLRNNAATAYIVAGLDDRTIADAMGWSVKDVEQMRRVYVDREAVVSAAIIMLRGKNRT
jgi:hypothetical protein